MSVYRNGEPVNEFAVMSTAEMGLATLVKPGNPFADHWKQDEPQPGSLEKPADSIRKIPVGPDRCDAVEIALDSLNSFLQEIRSSCSEHAERKGYLNAEGRNVAGEIATLAGVERDHILGEMLYKILEFKTAPRRVVAVKIAGWAWRLWLTAKE